MSNRNHPDQDSEQPAMSDDKRSNTTTASSDEQRLEQHFLRLRETSDTAPDHLAQRILAITQPSHTNHDWLMWFGQAWWRSAMATVLPMLLGLAVGLYAPNSFEDFSADESLYIDIYQASTQADEFAASLDAIESTLPDPNSASPSSAIDGSRPIPESL